MPRVYVEHRQECMEEIFLDIGWQVADKVQDADVLVLIGGADIDNSWYDAPRHPRTGGNLHRDLHTEELYDYAVEKGLAIIGICRGCQFMNARVGGGMYQDVNHHAGGRHRVLDLVSKSYHIVNSLHHQMIIPTANAVLIAKAVRGDHDEPIASRREIAVIEGEGRNENTYIVDVPVSAEAGEWEVVYYPEVKGLCFQGHPEYVNYADPCRQYFYELLNRYYPELTKGS